MNHQKKPEQFVVDIFADHGIRDSLSYYAWPETFGSTSGPRGGIGGQAMTTFTIEVWVSDNATLYLCAGMYSWRDGGFQIHTIPKTWTSLPTEAKK
jgi:hypothetical protein